MKALKVKEHSIITDNEIRLAVAHHNGSIHFPHRDKKYLECRIFHRDGTVQVSGNFSLNQIRVLDICHCIERVGYYDFNQHRIACYSKPMPHLLGIQKVRVGYYECDKYTIYGSQKRTVLRRFNGLADSTELYSFRTLPKYWIDWTCLILTLELGGK